jgi:hypothetical protein
MFFFFFTIATIFIGFAFAPIWIYSFCDLIAIFFGTFWKLFKARFKDNQASQTKSLVLKFLNGKKNTSLYSK